MIDRKMKKNDNTIGESTGIAGSPPFFKRNIIMKLLFKLFNLIAVIYLLIDIIMAIIDTLKDKDVEAVIVKFKKKIKSFGCKSARPDATDMMFPEEQLYKVEPK